MPATDPVQAVAAVVQARALSIDDAWAVLAAVRPLIEVQALREAAEALHGGEGPDLVYGSDDTYGDWLRARADRIEAD